MVPSDSRAMKVCPLCGRRYAVDDRFCAVCGVSLEEPPPHAEEEPEPASCPACSAPYAPGDRFCAVCGTSLQMHKEEPHEAEQQQATTTHKPSASVGIAPPDTSIAAEPTEVEFQVVKPEPMTSTPAHGRPPATTPMDTESTRKEIKELIRKTTSQLQKNDELVDRTASWNALWAVNEAVLEDRLSDALVAAREAYAAAQPAAPTTESEPVSTASRDVAAEDAEPAETPEEEPKPESCPACGAPYGLDDRFCAACGANLQIPPPDVEQAPDVESCPSCGAPRHDDAAFCSLCGTQFDVGGARAGSSRGGWPGTESSSFGTKRDTRAPEGALFGGATATVLSSKSRMLAIASSVFLILSTQMTWISVSFLGMPMGFKAADIGGGLVATGLLCGVVAVGVTFVSSTKTRAGTYLVAGVVCLLVLAVVWWSEMSPSPEMSEWERELAEGLQSLATQREGFYFYILAAVGLGVAGLAEWPGLLRAARE